MMEIKTSQEIAVMKEGGYLLGKILSELLDRSKPGVALNTIEKIAADRITQNGGTPSFQTVPGYKWATCLCVNDVVVHGVPSDYVLRVGDLLTIDIGMVYKGFHSDTAWTIVVGGYQSVKSDVQHFLDTGKLALGRAIAQAKPGNRIGNISKVIGDLVEGSGYSVMRTLVGHGIGRTLHEEPQIPGKFHGDIESTPKIDIGATLAIEVIYAQGGHQVDFDLPDGWSVATKDGSLSAVFEHTVAVTHSGPVILTEREK